MKQYQHFQEALFIAWTDFLLMNFVLIIFVSNFIIFTDDNINVITDDQGLFMDFQCYYSDAILMI